VGTRRAFRFCQPESQQQILTGFAMKVRNLYVINKTQRRFKARQG
jgi:hypothetical protein